MEYTDEIVKKMRREAYEEGYEAAMEKLRLAIRLAKSSIRPDSRRILFTLCLIGANIR